MMNQPRDIPVYHEIPGTQKRLDNQEFTALIGFDINPSNDCFLLVRLDNDNQTDQKLHATLQAAKDVFANITIILGDTLHTNLFDDEEKAQQRGLEWIEQNQSILKKFGIFRVKTWNHIKDSALFLEKKRNFENLYHTDETVRHLTNAICADRIRDLEHSMKKQNNSFIEDIMMQRVLDYRLEELAGLSVLHELGHTAELAPERDSFSDENYFDSLSPHRLSLPRSYPVSFVKMQGGMQQQPLSLAD